MHVRFNTINVQVIVDFIVVKLLSPVGYRTSDFLGFIYFERALKKEKKYQFNTIQYFP